MLNFKITVFIFDFLKNFYNIIKHKKIIFFLFFLLFLLLLETKHYLTLEGVEGPKGIVGEKRNKK